MGQRRTLQRLVTPRRFLGGVILTLAAVAQPLGYLRGQEDPTAPLRTEIPAAAAAAAPAATQPGVETYANPLDVLLADPFVFRHGDTYYLYGTSGRGRGTMAWSSKDLVNWRDHGYVFDRTRDTWSRGHYWAPEVFEHNGKFYLHITASGRTTSLRLVLCESDSPTGPFLEVKAPWFETDKAVIDGNVFKDDDGQLYLYYVRDTSEYPDSRIHVRKLSDDLVPSGETHFCVGPSQPWEGTRWNEGPFVFKRGGTYYLMYSANYFGDRHYSVGYATASSPLGPWTKAEHNPILAPVDGVSGPGHNSVIESPDGREQFIVYHTHQQPSGRKAYLRHLAIDRLRFVDDDPAGGPPRMVVAGPTVTPQPVPSGVTRAFARGQDEEFDGTEIDRDRWTVFSESPERWTFRSGHLVITADDGDVAEDRADLTNLFLQRAPHGDFDVTTRVRTRPRQDFEQAFLILWQDHNHFLKLGTVWSQGGPKFELSTEVDGKFSFALTENTIGEDVFLRVTKRGDTYGALVSPDGRTWTALAADLQLSLHDLRVGVGAASPISTRPVEAAFDFLRFTRPDPAAAAAAAAAAAQAVRKD